MRGVRRPGGGRLGGGLSVVVVAFFFFFFNGSGHGARGKQTVKARCMTLITSLAQFAN